MAVNSLPQNIDHRKMTLFQRRQKFIIALPFFVWFVWAVIQTAWVSDDAYITFRSIENFIHGYGPIFNIGERVQTFTHPLWFLLQSLANWIIGLWKDNPLGTSRLYYINILLSVAISGLTALVYLIAADGKNAALGLTVFALSKAFVDYSTSGLENPLSHLLLVVFLAVYLQDKQKSDLQLYLLSCLAALSGTNRVDLILLFLPALFYLFWVSTDRLKTLRIFALGFLPLILWETFSIFYYGFPFPNTAMAKLNTGISLMRAMEQGVIYYLNSLRLDPLTQAVIYISIILCLFKRDNAQRAMILGVLLYLFYILYIGGDFMSGRFFTPPLVIAVFLLFRTGFNSIKVLLPSFALIVIVGLLPIYLIPERNPAFIEEASNLKAFVDTNGISDERNFYYRQMGFLNNLDGSPAVYKGEWVYLDPQPVQVEMVGTLGVAGYRLGPNVHVIDRNALADPLMGHMPLEDENNWRIGHFHHILPEGYIETLTSEENQITNPSIALYYDMLSIVIKGDLWDWARFVEIWNLNTGKYEIIF